MQGASRRVVDPPEALIPIVLNECQESLASHHRNSLLLLQCARQHRDDFTPNFLNVIRPALLSQRAGSPGDTVLRFFKTFMGVLMAEGSEDARDLMEEIVCLFSQYSEARSKAVRLNVTKVLSEVLNSLPGSFSLTADAIVIVREFLHCRMDDRVAAIRAWAARALKRMVTFEEDGGVNVDTTIELFREKMKTETSAEVREAMVWSSPESTCTIPDILDRTADVSQRVRAAAYRSFAERFFPLESFSIRQRVQLLSQGLSDRSSVVREACVQLVCRAWLTRDCEGDLVRLLRHVDVESHEVVAESAVNAVLQAHSAGWGEMELVVPEGGLRSAARKTCSPGKGNSEAATAPGLLAPEEALFWRMLCLHLAEQADESGSNAAVSAGAAAVVAAEAASDLNAQLEALLPSTAHDYLALLEAHMQAGCEGRFAARQLMRLAGVLDFTDATIRAHAAALLHRCLVGTPHAQAEGEAGGSGEGEGAWEEGLTDGRWGEAVLGLAQRVHASDADVLAALVDALADVSKPLLAGVTGVAASGEGGSSSSGVSEEQWLRCVAATRMVLRQCCKAPGGAAFRAWRNLRVEPQEALNCILVPAASHPSPLVRREAIAGLHVFAMLHAPSARPHVPLLHAAARDAAHPAVQMAAVRALLDLLLWHQPAALLPDVSAPALSHDGDGSAVSGCGVGRASGGGGAAVAESSLDVLVGLVPLAGGQVDIEAVRDGVEDAERQAQEEEEKEGVVGVVCEGLCKLLLADASRGGMRGAEGRDEGRVERLLQLLVAVYLCPGAAEDELPRTRQMLAEFFNRVAVLPACKVAASRLLLPMLRQLWPRKATAAARQPAVRASQLLLSIMLAHGAHGVVPPTHTAAGDAERAEEGEGEGEGAAAGSDGDGEGERGGGAGESSSSVQQPSVGFESLALDLAAEVLSSPLATAGSATAKAYSAHLVQLLVEVPLRAAQQDDIKCLRSLLPMLEEAVAGQRAAERQVERMAARLRGVDATPDEELPLDRLELLLQRVDDDAASGSEAAGSDVSGVVAGSPAGRRRRGKQPASARRTSPSCDPEPATPAQRPQRPSRQSKERANSLLKQQLGGDGTSSAGKRVVEEAAAGAGESAGVGAEEGGEHIGSEGPNRSAYVAPEAHSSGDEGGSESGSEDYGSESESEEEYLASSSRRGGGRRASAQRRGSQRVSSVLEAVRRRRSGSSSSSASPIPISISTDDDDSQDVVQVVQVAHSRPVRMHVAPKEEAEVISVDQSTAMAAGVQADSPSVGPAAQRKSVSPAASAGSVGASPAPSAASGGASPAPSAGSSGASPAASVGSESTSFASALSDDLVQPSPSPLPAAMLPARTAAGPRRRFVLDESESEGEGEGEGWGESGSGSDEDSGSSAKGKAAGRGGAGEQRAGENEGVGGKAGKGGTATAAAGRRQPLARLTGQ
ncbi:hypothetical protein CLOP_g19216 [Closterium sp. NIES-67]|nr:hypothetical protein CLOP_g19216 [Closterium sp. NIES-67]